MNFRMRAQILFPVIARIADVHMSILNRGIDTFLAPSSRYYDSVATYLEVKDASELEIAVSVGAKMFLKTDMKQVKGTYFDTRQYTNYLPSEITSGPIQKPKMLVLGKEHESFVETLFDYSTADRESLQYETWGFSHDYSNFNHWTPGDDEEDAKEVNSSDGYYLNHFPSKTSMVHNIDGKPECFDMLVLSLQNWSNRSRFNRDNFDWAEEHLRHGGVMILSGKYYHLKSLCRTLVSRFESIQIVSHNENIGIFGDRDAVTLVGVKKLKRSRDDFFAEILEQALTPDKSGYKTQQLVHPYPNTNVYPPESVIITDERKIFDDTHLLELEEVECMLSPGDNSWGIDTYKIRQEVEGIIECKMAMGTSYGYHIKIKGSSIPMMREKCAELEHKVRFKGEKSHVERTVRVETRETNLASDLSPVILSKETDPIYLSLFAHESPLRLHSGLLQKKTEHDKLTLPVPPKITNLTKLTQHLRGIVQGPDNYWLATKGTVETVKTSCTSESDDGTVTFTTTKKRVKQVGILLDGPDKGAIIEVEAA